MTPAIRLDSASVAHVQSIATLGLATATLVARRAHLRRFTEWCDRRGITLLADVALADIEAYRGSLHQHRKPDGRALSASTQVNLLTAVRMLFAWATRTKLLATNPALDLVLPRLPNQLPRAVLSSSEVERVLAVPALASASGLRDRAIIEVLYSTGIRRMELVGLDVPDVDFQRGTVFVREGKGRKDRVVPVGARAMQWVERYLDRVRRTFCRERNCSALFLTSRGARLRPSRLTDRMHAYIRTAGIAKPGSVHIFRHTMATLMHDAGADIRDLQEILGHALLTTTAIYTRVSIERLRAVHARTHPARVLRSPAPIAHLLHQ